MSKIFNTGSKIDRVKEPLFQVSRMRYRGSRYSELENLETNLLKLDITRINQELDTVDQSVLDTIELFTFSEEFESASTTATDSDGHSWTVDNVGISVYNQTPEIELEVDTIDKISGQLSRIFNKVQRLEAGM